MWYQRPHRNSGGIKTVIWKDHVRDRSIPFPEASKEVQETILEKCCVYEEEALEENQQDICYPDVREVIKQLAKTYDLYIVSNCQCGYIEQFLRKTQLEAYIKDIECFGNTGKNKGENIRLLVKRNSLKAQF